MGRNTEVDGVAQLHRAADDVQFAYDVQCNDAYRLICLPINMPTDLAPQPPFAPPANCAMN
jgi:hypothetical protein